MNEFASIDPVRHSSPPCSEEGECATVEVEKLNKDFGHDITRCLRCNGVCNLGLSRCVEYRTDGQLAYDFGEQIYICCPSCRDKNLFPWSSFLIVSNQ